MSNEKSATVIDEGKKKAVNLYNALVNDSKSVFYATDKVTKTLIKKARNSFYKKEIVFANVYNRLKNKKFLPEEVPLNTPFVENKNKTLFVQHSIALAGTTS